MIITKEYIEANKTKKGAWTRSQFEALGLEVNNGNTPSKGWKNRVIGSEISRENAEIFEAKLSYKEIFKAPANHRDKIKRSKIKESERRNRRNKKNLEKIKKYKENHGIDIPLSQSECASILRYNLTCDLTPDQKRAIATDGFALGEPYKRPAKKKKRYNFYNTKEWRELRYKAFKLYGRACLCCGASPPDIVLHVDHIKPRSLYPELELDIDNLQILCKDCNLGKSNKDCIDYRK